MGRCGARRSWSSFHASRPFTSVAASTTSTRRASRSSRPTRRAAASPIRSPVQPRKRIAQAEADNLKARWEQAHQGRREVAVLGSGAKFSPVSIAPDEAQFIQTQKFSVATICGFYGVPPEMMAGETAGHEAYTSPEMRGTDFLTFTLRPGCCASSGPSPGCCPAPRPPSSTRGLCPRHPARPLRSPPHRHRSRLPDPQRSPRAGRPPAPTRRRARGIA